MANVEEKIKPWQKVGVLEDAVLTQTPGEVVKLYKSFDEVDFTATRISH